MKKKRIAVFGNGWSNEFYKYALEGIKAEADKDNVDVFAFVSYVLWDKSPQSLLQLNIIDIVNPEDYDGAILLTNTMNDAEEHKRITEKFKEAGVPLLSVEGKPGGVPCIMTENYNGMHELMEHMAKVHGLKKFVYVHGVEGNVEDNIRYRAFCDAIKEYSLTEVGAFDGEFGYSRAYDETQKWIDKGKELPDVFVCANDHMAIGVMTALYKNGITVPGDVRVTGFDNIDEGKRTFPMLATVSRGWDKMGTRAYTELMRQIDNPYPEFEMIYDSVFVPSESCGCEANEADIKNRMEQVRGGYAEKISRAIFDAFFQEMNLAAGRTGSKEEFPETMGKVFSSYNFLGKNFWLCIEPEIFDLEDKVYTHCVKGYSEKLDVIYRKQEGKSCEPFRFDTRELVPGYVKDPDSSDLFIICPLNYQDFLIGYTVSKNDPTMLYSQEQRRWVYYMENAFMSLRQNIFTLKANRKLQEIAMTDFLTGLYNRTGVEEILFGHIEKQKKKGKSTVLLFADIDRMKLINDNYGHLEGDVAIRATSSALISSCPKGFLMGRYGGDEFIAVGDYDHSEGVEEFCLRITESIKNYVELLHLSFPLSVSVGGKIIEPDTEGTIQDHIGAADRSMYERKEEAHRRLDATFTKGQKH
ncbi:MAG: GGDEF domain-containing protein [Lachnospiraceae bacterium]|nr:GGDEF domain-containing protein [Lachnospiraceae bacterium]